MTKTILMLVVLAAVSGGGAWYFFNRDDGSAAIEKEASEQVDAMMGSLSSQSSSVPRAQSSAPTRAETASAPAITTTKNNTEKFMHATLRTNQGDIAIEFFDAETPNTVANFVKLAGSGFYDGTKFHRVIKGFMIQGGDPFSKDDTQTARWGMGGPGYAFADEIHAGNKNDIGTIAMANAGPDTNGSQFFINVANNNFLDTKHTVFGRVISGREVVTAIENTPTGEGDQPLEPVTITGISLK